MLGLLETPTDSADVLNCQDFSDSVGFSYRLTEYKMNFICGTTSITCGRVDKMQT